MPLQDLKITFAWPEVKPNVPPDDHGWTDTRHEKFFSTYIPAKAVLMFELGAWLGKGTRFIASKFPNLQIISVDHWKGSPEHEVMPGMKEKLATLYETFLVNLWPYKDRVVPVRLDSAGALVLLKHYGLEPDVVYVDAGHDYDSVLKDLTLINTHFPNTLILGDDFKWKDGAGNRPVFKAVSEFCTRTGFRATLPEIKGMTNRTCYQIIQRVSL